MARLTEPTPEQVRMWIIRDVHRQKVTVISRARDGKISIHAIPTVWMR
jgi:hypothetical protein